MTKENVHPSQFHPRSSTSLQIAPKFSHKRSRYVELWISSRRRKKRSATKPSKMSDLQAAAPTQLNFTIFHLLRIPLTTSLHRHNLSFFQNSKA